MWRARNAFMLLSLIVPLWSAAVAQPGVTPQHRPTSRCAALSAHGARDEESQPAVTTETRSSSTPC